MGSIGDKNDDVKVKADNSQFESREGEELRTGETIAMHEEVKVKSEQFKTKKQIAAWLHMAAEKLESLTDEQFDNNCHAAIVLLMDSRGNIMSMKGGYTDGMRHMLICELADVEKEICRLTNEANDLHEV